MREYALPREYVRYLKRDLSSRCWLQEQFKSLAVRPWSLRTAAARNSRCRSSVRQILQELRGSQAEAAESASCGGCRSSLSRLLWAFKYACGSRDSGCWSSVRRGLRGMKEGGCKISLARRRPEQLESLAVGVACSSTGRSGQSLQEQRETEAAGAARVAGGGLRDQLQAGAAGAARVACFGRCMPSGRGPFEPKCLIRKPEGRWVASYGAALMGYWFGSTSVGWQPRRVSLNLLAGEAAGGRQGGWVRPKSFHS